MSCQTRELGWKIASITVTVEKDYEGFLFNKNKRIQPVRYLEFKGIRDKKVLSEIEPSNEKNQSTRVSIQISKLKQWHANSKKKKN